MRPSRIRVHLVAAGGVLALSLQLVSALPAAAERPTNPAQLLLWLLSLGGHGERAQVQKVDINSATAKALTAVPGVDRRQALAIIAHRPYAKLEELVRAGLSPRFIESLAGFLTVDSHAAERASSVIGIAPVTRTATADR